MAQDTHAEGQTEALSFQAEVQQLLHILAHSLYTEREIFLRELISNASDALHRLQFETLTNRDIRDPDAELAIHVDFDPEARTLTVTDTGIGMTREELIENLGTIAHSGAMTFLQRLEEGQRPADIIGQFGVGFYSVFMVAEAVTVTSRSYQPDAEPWTWQSSGESTYTLSPAEKESRGTIVEVQLKEDSGEFATAWRLEAIIKKHSNYIAFPISLQERVVNQRTALWRQRPQDISPEEYEAFYRQLTLDSDKPLLHVHIVTDVPVDIRALLFVPRQRERGLLRMRPDRGLRLYVRNVLIQEHNQDLLPPYLHFVEGVLDSEDLPLNVSRETVQSNPVVRRIHKALTGSVLKELRAMGESDLEAYGRFWEVFGVFLKEGVATDPQRREDLLPLLRFHSSQEDSDLVTLDDYVGRMQPDQKAIYYVIGEDLDSITRSPHLDYFRAHNLEVLYLVDPLDGFMAQSLREVQGKPLQNVDDAGLELPQAEEPPEEAEGSISENEFDQLLARFKQVLGDRVVDVQASRLLTNSPSRLVSPEDSPDRDLQRLRRLVEEDFEIPPKIMEINRQHPLIRNLARLVAHQPEDVRIEAVIEQLFDNLLLLEGLHPNPVQMIPRIQRLLEAATE